MNKIVDPQVLEGEFVRLGFKEVTYDELKKWEQYGIECDKDPRWKMKYRIYQLGELFWVIFERNGYIYSSKGFGCPQPEEVVELLNNIQWRDDDYDYNQF